MDERIDTSEIPVITDFSKARPNQYAEKIKNMVFQKQYIIALPM